MQIGSKRHEETFAEQHSNCLSDVLQQMKIIQHAFSRRQLLRLFFPDPVAMQDEERMHSVVKPGGI